MELNTHNIIKAMECCDAYCKGQSCPYHVWDKCINKLSHDALALIKELSSSLESSEAAYRDLWRKYEDISKDNIALHETCTKLTRKCASLATENRGFRINTVEVVRCKDCIYRRTPDCSLWYGSIGDIDYIRDMGDNFYCSCGERGE